MCVYNLQVEESPPVQPLSEIVELVEDDQQKEEQTIQEVDSKFNPEVKWRISVKQLSFL